MTSPILVTGGTGTLGRLVVGRLQDAGCQVRVLSRRSREAGDGAGYVTGDLATGEGRNARWLAEQGWSVTGVDFSPSALASAAGR